MRASLPIRDFFRNASLGLKKMVGSQVELDPDYSKKTIQNVLAHTGVIAFGETHGIYSHADFVAAFMPYARAADADRLYVEMFHERNQRYIDQFQDDGDPSGLIWLMNNSPSYSDKMWVHFFEVLKAARDNGLRIVTVEPDRHTLHSVFPGMEIFYKNLRWENAIRADQKKKKSERPFVLYCGAWHLDRFMCCNASPIHEIFGGAGVAIDNGEYCLIRPGSGGSLAYAFVPRAPHQTPITMRPIRRKPQISMIPA